MCKSILGDGWQATLNGLKLSKPGTEVLGDVLAKLK
jgi:hypothetical protein